MSKSWNNDIRRYENIFSEPLWKEAQKLNMDDFVGMVINTNSVIPSFSFSKKLNQFRSVDINTSIDDEFKWFSLGYFLGNGWVEDTKDKAGRCKNIIKFSICTKNENEVVSNISHILNISINKGDSSEKCHKYECCNFCWYNIFKKFGKYSYGKIIPEWVMDAPIKFVRCFLEGYIFSDGHICKDGTISFTTTS